MIAKDFKIDFEKKKISYVGKNKKIYSAREFYSFLQDTFDEPENMKYDIPIEAKSQPKAGPPLAEKIDFELINGWTIDKESLKYIKGIVNSE